jgi:pimeloyl-ACP methyl ester carboxylesterase
MTFQSDGLALSGVVHVPDALKAGERRPAIIMMHGFGANKNGGPEWACRQFESWGYVALRFDYRGCGESEGERGRVIAMEEVADARNAVSAVAARPDVDPKRIALCGSSLGAGVAVQAAAMDERVGAVILENGLGHGERVIRSMHTPESWNKFLQMVEDGRRHREQTGHSKMVHRFEIFEMPKDLQVNLTSNNSLMHFTAETAVSFFMFRPEDVIGSISPRPILMLHSARDRVCTPEEAYSLARHAKPPFELHLMDGADHFMFVDTDPRVAQMLRDWLNKYFPCNSR